MCQALNWGTRSTYNVWARAGRKFRRSEKEDRSYNVRKMINRLGVNAPTALPRLGASPLGLMCQALKWGTRRWSKREDGPHNVTTMTIRLERYSHWHCLGTSLLRIVCQAQKWGTKKSTMLEWQVGRNPRRPKREDRSHNVTTATIRLESYYSHWQHLGASLLKECVRL